MSLLGPIKILGRSTRSLDPVELGLLIEKLTDANLSVGDETGIIKYDEDGPYGLEGKGFQIRQDSNGETFMFVDRLMVRNQLISKDNSMSVLKNFSGNIIVTNAGQARVLGFKKIKEEVAE